MGQQAEGLVPEILLHRKEAATSPEVQFTGESLCPVQMEAPDSWSLLARREA